jgi:murein hydrolase activator
MLRQAPNTSILGMGRQSRFNALVIVLALLGVLFMASSVAQAPEDKAKSQELRERLNALKQEIIAVNAVLSSKAGERDRAALALQTAELAIAQSARAVIELNTRLGEIQREFEALSQQEFELSNNLQAEQKELAQLLRSAYAIGQMEQVKLVLSQEKVAKVGRVLAYHTYVNQARIRAIERIQSSLSALAQLRAQIATKQSEISELITQESAKSSELQAQRLARTELLQRLAREVKTSETRLSELSADQHRLNDLLSRLSDLLADIPKDLPNALAFARLKGSLPKPVKNTTALLRRFGEPTETGRTATGLVFSAPVGSEIRAIAGGRVAFADWLRGFGLLMIIDHGDGFLSLYGQCETLLSSEGEWISAGSMIGTSGEVDTLGPGLYFEMRKAGKAVDPTSWFSRAAPVSARRSR